jgi:predicted nucleic acid-binding protein
MARYFFDSSALIKFYHDEIGSPRVHTILADSDSDHFIARLTAVELLSGLAKKVRMGAVTAADYDQLRRRFRADINRGLLHPLRMLNRHFDAAGDLIDKHAIIGRLRALDSIQLAVALGLQQVAPVDYFVCADRDLCVVAGMEGLTTIDPG